MILTVTPNPAFDRIQTIPAFHPGRVCRSTALTLSAAGKGINVARAVRNLGGNSMCAGFLGGHTGRLLADFTIRDGIPAQWTWIDGETRVSTIILSMNPESVTVINEAGPTITLPDWDRLQADILTLAANARAVCLSGSLPPGLPPEVLSSLIQSLNRDKRRVFVDSSGAPLRASIAAAPEVIKINVIEAASLLGWNEFDDINTSAQAAQTIRAFGISKVVLTLGAKGAVLAGNSGLWVAQPPPIKVISPIGSGDAFFAGMASAMLQELPDPEVLRQAVAAGSANALSIAGGSFSRQDVNQVLAGVTLNTLP
jgi:1-phosphofructokinase family hexose kinase